jgi:glutamyl-tRNA synthetase
LHLGGLRTALFNWLFAEHVKAAGGDARVLLRLEDTDRERSDESYVRSIADTLQWLDLSWDGPVWRQSDRSRHYQDALVRLEQAGRAYRCYCPQAQLDKEREMARAAGRTYRYPRRCRQKRGDPSTTESFVWRFAAPDQEARPVMDRILGRVAIHDVDDFVLTRSDASPLYHLCCVVDDALMGVTHVIRGADHVDNTRRQAMLYDALGWPRPEFAHLPLVSGLSKRLGATSIDAFRRQGFLPEALLNYVVRLGWSHGDQEVFSRQELGRLFRLEDVGHSPARVNPDKLQWLNEQHLHRAQAERLRQLLDPWLPSVPPSLEGRLLAALDLYKTRCQRLDQLAEAVNFALLPDDQVPGAIAETGDVAANPLLLGDLARLVRRVEPYRRDLLKASMWEYLQGQGLGFRQVAPLVRQALTGCRAGPRLLDLMMCLGHGAVVARLHEAARRYGASSTLEEGA